MSKYLLCDFGSTFTKLTAVCSEKEDIIATSLHYTTVESDISIGFNNALNELYKKIGEVKFDKILACSSAAGGLKMCCIGLVSELTTEAGKRVCLGAGSKVSKSFSNHLTSKEINQIKDVDIILLAGGTDGGNSECCLYNANKLGLAGIKIPIIFAGNKCCCDEISEIFEKYQMDGYIVDNIMPKINVVNPEKARELIRKIFLERIIEARGIKKIEGLIDKVVEPTPSTVILSSELLSRGYLDNDGLGELCVVDIGGATTDFYSMSTPSARRSDVVLKGLSESYAKRTVEGDLGMRYSCMGVVESLTEEEIIKINKEYQIDLVDSALKRVNDVSFVPVSEIENQIDVILASVCVDQAMKRHVGVMEEVYTPMGIAYNQIGKDLTQVGYIIGTGGVLVNSKNPRAILEKVQASKKNITELRPVNPKYLLDKDYIMQAMGLLLTIDKELSLKIMKKRLVEI